MTGAPPEVTEAIQEWEGQTEAERLGLLVVGVASSLEQRALQATAHLQAVVKVLEAQGTTFAHDTHALEEAQAFLQEVGSDQSPEQDKDTP